MFKRLFLAATVTFPLYLFIWLDGPATISANSTLQGKVSPQQIVREIKEDIAQIHQGLQKLKSMSTEVNTFVK